MSKGHRDNHAARLKRGPEAFAKKAQRRQPTPRCKACGKACRASVLRDEFCPVCLDKAAGTAARERQDP